MDHFQKESSSFQPSIFRGYVSYCLFSGRVYTAIFVHPRKKCQAATTTGRSSHRGWGTDTTAAMPIPDSAVTAFLGSFQTEKPPNKNEKQKKTHIQEMYGNVFQENLFLERYSQKPTLENCTWSSNLWLWFNASVRSKGLPTDMFQLRNGGTNNFLHIFVQFGEPL